MPQYLYRYISFETFVGMVQKQALTFVLPKVWDDPKERTAFYSFIEKRKNIYERMMYLAIHGKTYAQCWTQQEESDAMWRIYAYGNHSIRIKTSREKISQLEKVTAFDVKYVENPEDVGDEKNYFEALTQKRKAFEHEKEVRLINSYQFKTDEDFEKHVKALMVVSGHSERVKLLENLFPKLSMEEQVKEVISLLNIGENSKNTKDISYAHINEFIEGVMVHPMAPAWYVEIVEEFCQKNNILFEGKSVLYTD